MRFRKTLICLPLLISTMLGHAADVNIALDKPVTAVGASTTNPASNVTDGDAASYSLPAVATPGFYYQIDLGAEYPLQTIELYSRINSGANLLSKVTMAVYADSGGVAGAIRWSYQLRPTGTNNPQGGVDVLTKDLDPTGTFKGRFIRITNTGNTGTAPQVAEIMAYEADKPDIRYFGPNAGNITQTGNPALPSQSVISWKVANFTSLSIDQGIGTIAGSTGSITVSPTANTTYTLTASNGAGSITKTVTIGVDQTEAPPSISEFLAKNDSGIQDAAGVRNDWIELYNPNSFAINLKDYYLTDDLTNKIKWKFPSFAIPGNGYAIVFADGIGTSEEFEAPHASFALNTSGETLGLIAKDGTTVLSQIPADYPTTALYPKQFGDHSYGIVSGQYGYFFSATPNAENGTRYDGVVEDTKFSIKRGFYDTSQSVAITTVTPSSVIRYTTDGSAPTATTGTIYTEPITFSSTTVIRAAAFRSNFAPTNVDTNTYVFTASVISSTPWAQPTTVTNYSADMVASLRQIPSMSLTVGPATIKGGVDSIGAIEWLNPTTGENVQFPCGAQLFGGAFTNFTKKSFRVSFKSAYGAGKFKFPIFKGFERGLAAQEEFDSFELRNGSHDMSQRGFYMSNMFTDATLLDMGSFAAHGRFVHLYLNGVYWGLYHLRERWGADMISSYFGGLSSDYESINGNLNVGGWANPGTVYDGTGEAWERIKSLARSGSDVYTKLQPYVDVSQYVDYMTMFMFGTSEDEYRITGPADVGHGMKFILNDADGYLTFSGYGSAAQDRTARDAPGLKNGDGPGSIFSLLYKDGGSTYRRMLSDRIHRNFVNPSGAMTPAANQARLDGIFATIDKALIAECARWNYRTPANWISSKDDCRNSWMPNRTNTVISQYTTAGFYSNVSAPTFAPAGGTISTGSNITMSGTASIYYTTDGSDPSNQNSIVYNAPLITAQSAGKYRIPTSPSDGFTSSSIPNLLAYYDLNTNANDSASGYNGTLTSGAAILSPGKYGAGAANFDGTNDYISLGDPAGLKITGQITLSAWVKPDAVNGLRNIINKGHDTTSSPNGEITLRINGGAYQGGYWSNSSTVIASGNATGLNSATNDIGVWTHIAIVWDGTTWRLYRNGSQIASAASTIGAVTVPAVGWAIGARGNGTERFFDGLIDEVRIYNRGLSPTEIISIYNNTLTNSVATWSLPATSDVSWSAITTPAIGFSPPGDLLATHIGQNISTPMLNQNATAFMRYPFSLTAQEKSDTSALRLKIKADDGYVIYLNGTRIASRNAPSILTGTSAATAETPDAVAIAEEVISLDSSIALLQTGNNVLAIQGLNLSSVDDDFLHSVTLESYRGIIGLNATALLYSAPLALTKSTIVKARSYNAATQTWSALQESFYQMGAQACPPGDLVISEIHYNPNGDDDGEFIEFMNVSSAAINLRGANFSNGITFSFPNNRDVILVPGERIVLVDSQFTFQQIQGWSAKLGGIYSGSLSNDGEQITLLAADGITTIIDFIYNDKAPWPIEADGAGQSLVLINQNVGANLNDPCNWRPSLAQQGNPNTNDATTFSGIAPGDDDLDGLTNYMEYALGSSSNSPNPSSGLTFSIDSMTNLALASVDHAAAADSANLRLEASANLVDWNIPVTLTSRQVQLNGKLRSSWQIPATSPRLFLRLRTGE